MQPSNFSQAPKWQPQDYQSSMQPPPFEKTNTLLCRSTPTSHSIASLTKKEQNIQLVLIIVSKQPPIKTKTNTITQCLVADESASMFMNFYDAYGTLLQEGDIVYASGVYASHYREMLLLYQGTASIVKRIGRNFMRFNLSRNMSLESLDRKQPS